MAALAPSNKEIFNQSPEFGGGYAKKEPVFIEADNIDYDTANKIVSATGKVEILKGDRKSVV